MNPARPSSQLTISSLLCPAYCIQPTISNLLYPAYYIQRTVSSLIHPAYCIQLTISSLLYPAYCIQLTISSLLYPAYCIQLIISSPTLRRTFLACRTQAYPIPPIRFVLPSPSAFEHPLCTVTPVDSHCIQSLLDYWLEYGGAGSAWSMVCVVTAQRPNWAPHASAKKVRIAGVRCGNVRCGEVPCTRSREAHAEVARGQMGAPVEATCLFPIG